MADENAKFGSDSQVKKTLTQEQACIGFIPGNGCVGRGLLLNGANLNAALNYLDCKITDLAARPDNVITSLTWDPDTGGLVAETLSGNQLSVNIEIPEAETDGVHVNGAITPVIDITGETLTFQTVNDADESAGAPLVVDLSSLMAVLTSPNYVAGDNVTMTVLANGDVQVSATDTDTDQWNVLTTNADGSINVQLVDANGPIGTPTVIAAGGSDTTVSDNGDGTVKITDPNGDSCDLTAQKLQDNCGQNFAKGQTVRVLRPGDTNVVTAQSGTQNIINILRTELAAVPERTTATLREDTALLTINNPYTCASLRNNIDFGGMAVARYDTTNINWTSANADIVSEVEIFNAANNFVFGKRMEYTGGYGNRQYHGERYAAESHVVTSIPANGSLTIGGRIKFTNWHFGPPIESVPARLVIVLPIIYYTGHVVY